MNSLPDQVAPGSTTSMTISHTAYYTVEEVGGGECSVMKLEEEVELMPNHMFTRTLSGRNRRRSRK
jgi:hypothetical protein